MARPGRDLPAIVQKWLTRQRSHNTRRMYAHCMRGLWLWADCKDLTTLTTEDILQAAERYQREKSPAPASWNQMVSAWRSFYEHLIDVDKIEKNPARVLDKRSLHDKRMPTPTQDEVAKLWAILLNPDVFAANDDAGKARIVRDRALFALLTTTALRNFEITGNPQAEDAMPPLKVGAFDFAHREVRINAKGGKTVDMPWPEGIDRFLGPQLNGRPVDEPAFWNNRHTGPLSDAGLNQILTDLCRHAGIERYTAHAFRRYCATRALEKYPLHVVQKWMRHKSPDTTVRYDANSQNIQPLGDLPWETTPN